MRQCQTSRCQSRMILWFDLPTLLCRFSSVNYTDISITLLATSTLRNGAGMALGPVLGGLIWTQTGDYTGVLVLSFGYKPGRGAVHPRPAQHLLLPAPSLGGAAPA